MQYFPLMDVTPLEHFHPPVQRGMSCGHSFANTLILCVFFNMLKCDCAEIGIVWQVPESKLLIYPSALLAGGPDATSPNSAII